MRRSTLVYLTLLLAVWPTANLDLSTVRRPLRSTVLLTDVQDADRKSENREETDSNSLDDNFEFPSLDYPSNSANSKKCEPTQKILFTKLKNYSRHSLPNPEGMVVTVELHVQDISAIDEVTSEFDIDIMFSEMWFDPALVFTDYRPCKRNISMEYTFLRRLWSANSCIINTKDARIHKSPTENIFVIIYEDGKVWVNYRMRVRGPCELDFQYFPLDTQTCQLRIESYSFNADEVQLIWDSVPVTLMKEIALPDFTLTSVQHQKLQNEYPNGKWDQLVAEFTFKRRFGFYFMQAYVPTYIVIVISWVSFYVDVHAMPARTTLGVSSLLALTFQFGNIVKNLPRVSYVKALDVFMLGSTMFIFGTLVELALVSYVSRRYDANKAAMQLQSRREKFQSESESPQSGMMRKSPASMTPSKPTIFFEEQKFLLSSKIRLETLVQSEAESRAKQTQRFRNFAFNPEIIDAYSLYIFPISFLLFNAIYWCYYMVQSEQVGIQQPLKR